ncbi:hypothetical protein [Chitinophaga sp. XS-30]|uniref:hypothetical protein n=1 Tax=Chitinophaga sp. XS-30 TaxID=2604421 RepID=UPI0011DC7CFB|nr:hypothetical protein [Chitinophaga sp. XS-30]QEH40308.1 hypothetical protein FW415_05235 [Chitinophaga sp. XS-30]
MEKLIAAFVNRSTAPPPVSGDGLHYSGWAMMDIIPWMAIPLLLVLFAGLYFMSLSRRKHQPLH